MPLSWSFVKGSHTCLHGLSVQCVFAAALLNCCTAGSGRLKAVAACACAGVVLRNVQRCCKVWVLGQWFAHHHGVLALYVAFDIWLHVGQMWCKTRCG